MRVCFRNRALACVDLRHKGVSLMEGKLQKPSNCLWLSREPFLIHTRFSGRGFVLQRTQTGSKIQSETPGWSPQEFSGTDLVATASSDKHEDVDYNVMAVWMFIKSN